MDVLPFIIEMLSEKALSDFFSDAPPSSFGGRDMNKQMVAVLCELTNVQRFMKTEKFKLLPGDKKNSLIEELPKIFYKLGNFMSNLVGFASTKQSSSSVSHDLVEDFKEIYDLINSTLRTCYKLKQSEGRDSLSWYTELVTVKKSIDNIKRIENILLETADCSTSITPDSALLITKAVPALGELKDYFDRLNFRNELDNELAQLPHQICMACEGQDLAVVLIGSLLSLKPMTNDTWNSVRNDLVKIKESNNCVTDNHMGHIITYCYDDLPYFLKPCFLYFACFPIGYEISATSLTEKWIAEGFVTPEEGDSKEETARKYLEQLVQRSLVCVLKRSFSGTIKSCRVHSTIHKFAIKQSQMDGFLVANPNQETIKSLLRLAIHHDNKNEYTDLKTNHLRSFLAFNFHKNVLGSAVLLRVLELRKSIIPITLPDMIFLRYLSVRGSNIFELPNNIGDMKNLQTLDVRETSIKMLPESLWNISTLRNVYVKHSPQIKGPPSTANLPDLQILKAVDAHESWQNNFPKSLIHLRKLALSNCNNLEWKSISNLLSQMDKLISMTIMGKIIPSEFVDTRAFPNLKTVKSIKLEGEWKCRKLPIHNVTFPPNLTKLTLTNSGLKEDPMSTLEKLKALKFLSLQDGAYTGKQMVCSANGFPQLQFLELLKLENLEIWEVERTAMLRLSRLCVDQCGKLNDLPNLHCVCVNDTDDDSYDDADDDLYDDADDDDSFFDADDDDSYYDADDDDSYNDADHDDSYYDAHDDAHDDTIRIASHVGLFMVFCYLILYFIFSRREK